MILYGTSIELFSLISSVLLGSRVATVSCVALEVAVVMTAVVGAVSFPGGSMVGTTVGWGVCITSNQVEVVGLTTVMPRLVRIVLGIMTSLLVTVLLGIV